MGRIKNIKPDKPGELVDLSVPRVVAAESAAQPAPGATHTLDQGGGHFAEQAREAGRILMRCLKPLTATERRELLGRVRHNWRSEAELEGWIARVQAARATVAYLKFFAVGEQTGALLDLAGLIFVRLGLRVDPPALLRWANTYMTLGAGGLLERRGRPRGRKPVPAALIIGFADRLSRGLTFANSHRLTLREALRTGQYFPCEATLRGSIRRGDGVIATPKLPRRRVDRIRRLLTEGSSKN